MTLRLSLTAALLATAATAPLAAQDAPIVLPGAPGEASRTIDAREAIAITGVSYAPGDVRFMQDMIVHHRQAVTMAELAKTRASDDRVKKTADRILASQADEIDFMREWLEARGESVTRTMVAGSSDHEGHDLHAGHDLMQGMASAEEMAELATLSGSAFDRMFLDLMVEHHQGAVAMVETLHRSPGTAYEPTVFEFTNEVVTDQNAEIGRMNALLAMLSNDPRATLAAGFRDAGEAISNMRLVAAMPKAAGFFDPDNPAQLQPLIEDESEAEAEARADGEEIGRAHV